MLFVPPSMPPVEAQNYEIPSWIKNTAGWWADGQIDDDSFLKGIKYLNISSKVREIEIQYNPLKK